MAATGEARLARIPGWVSALAPLVLVGILVGVFLVTDPIAALNSPPPIEEVAIEHTVLKENEIVLDIRNDGPDTVEIAQVLVNDAYRPFEIGDRSLGRLESTTVHVPYPWEEGLPLNIALLTRNGVPIEHEIEAATLTPDPGVEALWVYAFVGISIGLIPVMAGLLWFPALRRASPAWVAFLLAFTVGLLGFLLIDTIAEGLELAAETGAALDGVGLFGLGVIVAVVVLNASGGVGRSNKGMKLALLIALGIGLHNLGEGLAVGAATAAGEVALGTFLVIGFMIHNTTEGLAIVAPLSEERPTLRHFVLLGAIAGLPTVVGAWIGGFAFRPSLAALFFGIAAGAIAQVVWTVGKALPSKHPLSSPASAAGIVAGLLVMYLTGLLA